MKTAQEYLKQNDFIPNDHGHYVYGCGYHNVSLVHILEEYASFYANQKLDEALEKCSIQDNNWDAVISFKELENLKDEI